VADREVAGRLNNCWSASMCSPLREFGGGVHGNIPLPEYECLINVTTMRMVQFKRRSLFVDNRFTKLTHLKFALC
jgi:hypothetical protein